MAPHRGSVARDRNGRTEPVPVARAHHPVPRATGADKASNTNCGRQPVELAAFRGVGDHAGDHTPPTSCPEGLVPVVADQLGVAGDRVFLDVGACVRGFDHAAVADVDADVGGVAGAGAEEDEVTG